MDKKIYSEWAFTGGAKEKRQANLEAYKDLVEKYNVCKESQYDRMSPDEQEEIDFVYTCVQYKVSRSVYEIVKDTTDMTQDEKALIIDNGNLCFGYSVSGRFISIYTD